MDTRLTALRKEKRVETAMQMQKEIEALSQMTVGQLRQKYLDVFGEESRSNHKQFLFRRIAWRIQALAEGGLSERARRRALEIANDADLRIRAPRTMFGQDPTLNPKLSVTRKVAGDLDSEDRDGVPHDTDAPAGCRGRILVPISGRDRVVVGAIAVYEQDPDLLGEDDLHMLETIADQLGGTIEQAGLFTSLERSYFETVEALSSALEAKDAYTLDHARSITDMSADVGRRLGMREAEIRDLKLGALLHDIGKIGVPTEIVAKAGPLTDQEL